MPVGETSHSLVLNVRPYQSQVVQQAPVVLRLRLENIGKDTVHIYFKNSSAMPQQDLFTLHARDSDGVEYELTRIAVLTDCGAPGAGVPFLPQTRLETDHVMCLRKKERPPEGGRSPSETLLGPGRYEMYATLRCPQLVRSNTFPLTITRAHGSDAQAIAHFESLPLYTQGVATYPAPEDKFAFGGKPEEVRRKLDAIHDQCADSVFAFWLDYWQAFYAMDVKEASARAAAVDEAFGFAARHASFALSDNLLFRAASRALMLGDTAKAREALNKIRADYPDTDIDPRELLRLEQQIEDAEFRMREKSDRP
jgi:hypothetical protein